MSIHPARPAPAARAVVFGALALAAAIVLACSESEQPLQWRDAVRAGLGADSTRLSRAAIVADAHDSVAVSTGSAAHWLVGKLNRSGTSFSARAFVRWDVTDLPEGTITAAHVNLALASVQFPDPLASGPFELRLYRVTSEWSQDSLSLEPSPSVDLSVPVAEAQIDTAGLAAGSGILIKADLFADPDFAALVDDWRADSTSNHGVMLRMSSPSPAGILRFFAHEGVHPTSGAELATPLLDVTVDTTTVSFVAVDDAYAFGPVSPPVAQPDSVLQVSGGFVQRAALRIDPLPLLGVDALPEPPAEALLRGVLRLHLERGGDWSLAAGQTVTIRAYEALIDWTADDPVRSAVLGARIAEATVAGEDSTLELGVASYLRDRIEGGKADMILLCYPEVDQVGSVLFKGRGARIGVPELEAVFGPIGRRWGR
jgi:hypothetical protein